MHPATLFFVAGVIITLAVAGECKVALGVLLFVVLFIACSMAVDWWRNRA